MIIPEWRMKNAEKLWPFPEWRRIAAMAIEKRGRAPRSADGFQFMPKSLKNQEQSF